jgi:hypothetical protein
MNYNNRWRLIFLLSSIFVLAACNGGGGDSAPTNSGAPDTPTPSPSSNWDQAVWGQSNWT